MRTLGIGSAQGDTERVGEKKYISRFIFRHTTSPGMNSKINPPVWSVLRQLILLIILSLVGACSLPDATPTPVPDQSSEGPTLVPIDPSPTPVPQEPATPVPTPRGLVGCTNLFGATCVKSFGLVNGALMVTLETAETFNPDNPPVLLINDGQFSCNILAEYPKRLYCTGAHPGPGDYSFEVQLPGGIPLYRGELTIPRDLWDDLLDHGPGGGDPYPYPYP